MGNITESELISYDHLTKGLQGSLGGTPAVNSVGTTQIKKPGVGSANIANSAVYAPKIANNAVGYGKITTGLQGSLGLSGPNSIGTTQIKKPGVGSENIESNAVYAPKIASSSVGYAKLTAGLQGSLGGTPAANSIGTTQIKKPGVGSENIANNAIGFSKITVGLQGSLGGSPGADSVGTTQIKKPGVGSENIYNGAVYGTKIADNEIGYSKLTVGLQGSLGGGSPGPNSIGTTQLRKPAIGSMHLGEGAVTSVKVAFNNIGTFNNVLSVELLSSISGLGTTLSSIKGITFDQTNHTMLIMGIDRGYVFRLGTCDFAAMGGSFAPQKLGGASPDGFELASDSNKLFYFDNADSYIYKIGTITGNLIGSFAGPLGALDMAYVEATHHLWVSDTDNYVKEYGTTTGNIIGSFNTIAYTNLYGLTYVPETQKLWGFPGNGYAFEIGTTNGLASGSIQSSIFGRTFYDSLSKRMWMVENDSSNLFKIGTLSKYSHIRANAIGSQQLANGGVTGDKLFDPVDYGIIPNVTATGVYQGIAYSYAYPPVVVLTPEGIILAVLDHAPAIGSFMAKLILPGTENVHYIVIGGIA